MLASYDILTYSSLLGCYGDSIKRRGLPPATAHQFMQTAHIAAIWAVCVRAWAVQIRFFRTNSSFVILSFSANFDIILSNFLCFVSWILARAFSMSARPRFVRFFWFRILAVFIVQSSNVFWKQPWCRLIARAERVVALNCLVRSYRSATASQSLGNPERKNTPCISDLAGGVKFLLKKERVFFFRGSALQVFGQGRKCGTDFWKFWIRSTLEKSVIMRSW